MEIEKLSKLLGTGEIIEEGRVTPSSDETASPFLDDPLPLSPDDLLSLPDVARILGVSTSKVYKMSAKKELPIVKIGERALVRRGNFRSG